jgi:hypothetical protein
MAVFPAYKGKSVRLYLVSTLVFIVKLGILGGFVADGAGTGNFRNKSDFSI